jgi:hypothetical protein
MTEPRQDKTTGTRRNSAEGQEPPPHQEAGQRRGAKTEAIRAALAEHPDWGAKQVHEEVNRRGVRVSIQLVYRVLEAVESLKTAATEPVKIEDLNLQELLEFKMRVVDPYGGLARVEALVKVLKKMQCPPAELGAEGAVLVKENEP